MLNLPPDHYIPLTGWMMSAETDIPQILHNIDVLKQDCQQEDSVHILQNKFTNILVQITQIYDGIDCLCYMFPERDSTVYINGSFANTDSKAEEAKIKAGITISRIVADDTIPLYINCKTGDISLQIQKGYFLALPILNQEMDIQGSLMFYSETEEILKTSETPLTAIAVAMSCLIKYQILPKILDVKTTAYTEQKIKSNNKFRQNTVAYRQDRQQAITEYTPRSTHIMGIAFGDTIGIGKATIHGTPPEVQNYASSITPNEEQNKFNNALQNVSHTLDDALATHRTHLSAQAIDCLEMHKLLLQDKMWVDEIKSGIILGLSIAAAVEYARQRTFFALAAIADPYIRERFADIDDLSNKLRLALEDSGKKRNSENDVILVAHSLGVSSLMEYNMESIKGIILETGSVSSHIAIIANTMNIPMLGQCTDAIQYINSGDTIIIDCDQSVAFVSPQPHTLRLYQRKQHQIKQREHYHSLIARHQNKDTKTRDGIKISLQMNAGLLSEISLLHDYDADGIGLFRTELTFMGWTRYPTVSKQAELYAKVLDQCGKDKQVIFRTLDIGGDKPLPYFDAPDEENPALGWRAIRIGIDRPAVLRTQITAFLKAASRIQKPLYIMVPLVAEVAEIVHIRNMLHLTTQRLKKSGDPLPPDIKIGVMLEVPSLLWQLDEVCNAVDFISVGTNDLMQYLFAADRGSALLHDRYDPLSPSMLRVLKHIIDTCNKHKTPVTICGEIAAQPLDAMALITMGYRNLSMPGARIPLIRNMCQSLDTQALAPYLKKVMCSNDHSVRIELQAFAQDHKINLT